MSWLYIILDISLYVHYSSLAMSHAWHGGRFAVGYQSFLTSSPGRMCGRARIQFATSAEIILTLKNCVSTHLGFFGDRLCWKQSIHTMNWFVSTISDTCNFMYHDTWYTVFKNRLSTIRNKNRAEHAQLLRILRPRPTSERAFPSRTPPFRRGQQPPWTDNVAKCSKCGSVHRLTTMNVHTA